MIISVPVTGEGLVGSGWGRADRVAVARVDDGEIAEWEEFDVRWGASHDEGTEGSHHARVVRFLRDQRVEAVVAHHMGQPMAHMLERMGIHVHLDAQGDAREAARAASRRSP